MNDYKVGKILHRLLQLESSKKRCEEVLGFEVKEMFEYFSPRQCHNLIFYTSNSNFFNREEKIILLDKCLNELDEVIKDCGFYIGRQPKYLNEHLLNTLLSKEIDDNVIKIITQNKDYLNKNIGKLKIKSKDVLESILINITLSSC